MMSTPDLNSEHTRPSDGERKGAPRVLVDRLANGWSHHSADVACDFVSRWSARFGCGSKVNEIGDSSLSFTCDLGAIRFAGMNDVACLLVAGGASQARDNALAFWRKANSPGRAIFFLAANAAIELALRSALPAGRSLILGPTTTETLLESDSPVSSLKALIRDHIPLRRLIPFDTEHPTEEHMFHGRARLLGRLIEEENVSFAIAGPGRIGKTSLMKQFLRKVLQSKDGSWAARFYIDLMPCKERDNDGVARFIALKMDGSSRSSRLTSDRLRTFFIQQRALLGRPPDLLLDESDEFVGLEVIQDIGKAARDGLCRLIIAGRGHLLGTVLGSGSQLQHRIELLRLDPLSDTEAQNLFLRPLEDLGFPMSDRRAIAERVLGLTGRLPHYVQFYGRRIAELMIEDRFDTISPSIVAHVRDEFETVKILSDPIFEIKNPRSRFAAFALLGAGHRALSLPQMQGVVHHQGVVVSIEEMRDIANELVIQNVLAWNQGRFQIANESLPYYAHTLGVTGPAMRELRAELSSAQ